MTESDINELEKIAKLINTDTRCLSTPSKKFGNISLLSVHKRLTYNTVKIALKNTKIVQMPSLIFQDLLAGATVVDILRHTHAGATHLHRLTPVVTFYRQR